MTYHEFVKCVIDQGIAAAKADYAEDLEKLNGSVAGFEACRGLSPHEIGDLLNASRTSTMDAYMREAKDYWWWRCYAAEVEWVANCVSAMLMNEKKEVIIPPTARGVFKAAEIIGVKNVSL